MNAEVIAAYPDKVKISIEKLEDFQKEESLKVGSYLTISDNEDVKLISMIENFSIEIKDGPNNQPVRTHIIEALPLGIIIDGKFERGGDNIAIPPKEVSPSTPDEIKKIFEESVKTEEQFIFSKLSSDPNISIPVDGNKFFNKHIAVVGSTGSGKSHAVTTLLQKAVNSKTGNYMGLNNSHIIIFDIHSEYKTAFPNANYIGIANLVLPYWLLNSEELQELFIDTEANDHKQRSILKEAIVYNKKKHNPKIDKIHYDSPVVFDLKEVLLFIQNRNNEKKDKENNIPYTTKDGKNCNYSVDNIDNLFSELVTYTGSSGTGTNNGNLINFIDRLEGKINDKRLEFLLGEASRDISFEETLKNLLGYNDDKKSNVTIIDLSGVPFEVLSITVSLISRILFDYGYVYKRYRYIQNENETVNNDIPLLLVYEEAHKYVPNSDMSKYRSSRQAIERIAKEGRKYGITLLLASQRPSEISETIFSQCNNFIAMRLTNPNDQNYVKKLLPDTLGSLANKMPSLKAGQCLLIGDAVVLPSVVQIERCNPEPSSNDIPYFKLWKEEWKNLNIDALNKEWIKK